MNGIRAALPAARRYYSSSFSKFSTPAKYFQNNRFFNVSEEVREALQAKRPVVALETTIYTHGFPYPDNVALASRLESLVRTNGGVPATIGVLNNVARVGLSPEELIELAASQGAMKISRRDVGFICGLGLSGRVLNGGTTIAGTMLLAHLAGIKVFATGGLGGVHRGGETSLDISADLTELGRTPVTVISSGCKSFLDIPRTLEYLETEGVGVATFRDGRDKNDPVDFPAFWSRDSGARSPVVLENEKEAANIIYAAHTMQLQSGFLFANPIPTEYSIPKSDMDTIIAQAVGLAEHQGIHGKDNTPFVLNTIRELSGGRSVVANKALVESNIIRGTKVAVELAKLESEQGGGGSSFQPQPHEANATSAHHEDQSSSPSKSVPDKVDILIAGSVAIDICCDFTPSSPTAPSSPFLKTSNSARITQVFGGVGLNLASAAHLTGASTRLVSPIGLDAGADAVRKFMTGRNLDTSGLKQVTEHDKVSETARYVAVNDVNRDLVLAMADMKILEEPSSFPPDWQTQEIARAKPKWVVLDANWSPALLGPWIAAARAAKAGVVFEPVSTEKSTRLFTKAIPVLGSGEKRFLASFPNHDVDVAKPNEYELMSMHKAAQDAGLFDTQEWWAAIDAFRIAGSDEMQRRLGNLTSRELVETGIPQQALQLLPLIPTLLITLGPQGVLLVQLLHPGHPYLNDAGHARFVLSRGRGAVGGVYTRLFPPAETVSEGDIVSVNGIGDTFLGVVMAGLGRYGTVQEGLENMTDLIPLGQKGAVLSLKTAEAVSGDLKNLKGEVDALRQ